LPKRMPIFYSALMLTGVNLLLRLVGTSFQVYISGRIGAVGVGLLQLTMSVGSMAMVAGMAGIRTGAMYLTAEELGKGSRGNVIWILSGSFSYSLIFSGAVAAVLVIFAPWIAENWIGEPGVASALRLYGAFLPLVCLGGVMTGYFTAANRIGTLAAVEVAEQAVSMAATMGALMLWAGTSAQRACMCVFFGSGIGTCLTLCCLVYLRLREGDKTGTKIPVARRLMDTAFPLAVADDLKTGINTVENLMVPKRLALCTLVENPLAAFGVVSGMVFPVLMFPSCILFALAELLIPELARCAAAGSGRRIQYLSKRSLKVALLYGMVFCGLEYLTAESLCLRLYNNAEAGKNLKLYAMLIPMLYCDLITDAMIKGLGQQKMSVRYNIVTSTLDVAFLFLLLPEYGMTGYFLSFFVTHLINFGLSLRRLLKITGIRIPFRVPALCLATLAASLAGAATFSNIPSRIFSFVLLLFSGLTLWGITGKEDVLWFRGLVRR